MGPSPVQTWGPFLESPETLRAIFGCRNSLCISRTEPENLVRQTLQIQDPHNHYAEVLCIITCTKTARLRSLDPIAEPRAQLQGVGLSVTELSVVVSLVTFHLP